MYFVASMQIMNLSLNEHIWNINCLRIKKPEPM